MPEHEPDQMLRPTPEGPARGLRPPATRSAIEGRELLATDLYRRYSAYVRSVACHSGLPADEVDDAVQDTFVVVYRRCRELQDGFDIKSWLRAIVDHVCRNRRRYRWRNSLRWQPVNAIEPDTLADVRSGAPDEAVVRNEARSLVLHAIRRLPPKAQQVFVLKVMMQLSIKEIAGLIQSSPNTVASRMRAVRRELERQFDRSRRGAAVARTGRPYAVAQSAAGWTASALPRAD